MALPTPRICNGHSTSKSIDQQATSSRRDLVTYLKYDKEAIKFSVVDTASPLLLLNYIKSKFPVYTESLRLRGGEGADFNVPASYEQTSANGLTIIINIPPIWENNSTEEAAAQSRGFDFITPFIGPISPTSVKVNSGAGVLSSGGVTPKIARSLDVETKNAEDPDELHYTTLDSNNSNVGPRGAQLPDFVFNYPNYKRVKSVSQLLDDYNTLSKQMGGIVGAKKLGPKEWGAVYDKNRARVLPAAENLVAVLKDTMNTFKYHSSPSGQVNDIISFSDAICNTAGGVSPFPVSPFPFSVGLRSAPISNVQTPCGCTEAETRGLKPMNAETPDELHYGSLDSNQSNVGTRGMKLSKEEFTEQQDQFDQALRHLEEAKKEMNKRELEKILQHEEYRKQQLLKQKFEEILKDPKLQSDPTDQLLGLYEDYVKGRKLREQNFKDKFTSSGVGSRSAPISNSQTAYDDGEEKTRGFNLSKMINTADIYKQQIDKTCGIAKSMAEQGREMYNKFGGVGLRKAAMTNQFQAEGYCSPCGKQNASQVHSVKEALDRVEARDSQIIDQVKQQQQARRMKVTEMLGKNM